MTSRKEGSGSRGAAWLRAMLLFDELIARPAHPIRALRKHRGMWARDRQLRGDGGDPRARRNLCVVVDLGFPTPTLDAGSERILRVASLVASRRWDVVVLSVLGRKGVHLAPDLEVALVQPTFDYDSAYFQAQVAEANLVILSRPQAAARLSHAVRRMTKGLVVYDTVDLHFLRLHREAEVTRRWRPRFRSVLYRSLEVGLANTIPCTVVVSEAERSQLAAHCPRADMVVIPTIHPRRMDPPPDPSRRRDLLFVGSFNHPPNVDAVRFLIAEVMPLVAASAPSMRIKVVGRGLPEDLQRVLGDDHLGWVEDLDPVIDESLAMIAPLRFGAGVKGKLGRALAAGLPIVTTGVGAEGLGLEDGRNALIRDDARGLAEACLELARDPDTWVRLSEAGLDHVEAHFSPTAVVAAVESLLARTPPLAPSEPDVGHR